MHDCIATGQNQKPWAAAQAVHQPVCDDSAAEVTCAAIQALYT